MKSVAFLCSLFAVSALACRKPSEPAPAPELASRPALAPPPQIQAPSPPTTAPDGTTVQTGAAKEPKGNKALTYVPPPSSLVAAQPKPVSDSPKAAPRGRGGDGGGSSAPAPGQPRKANAPQQPIDLQALTRAVEAFQQKFGLLPDSINALVAAGLVRSVPPPPAGFQYVIDETTKEVKLSKQ